MAAPDWPLFAAAVTVVTVVLLGLSRLSAAVIATEGAREQEAPPTDRPGDDRAAGPIRELPPLPTGAALAANVALTHGVVGAALVGLVWYASVPVDALGVGPPTGEGLAVGVGLGVGLYVASEAASALADHAGIGLDERLRELLAPSGPGGWALLLLVSLPLVALAEELLFRGILVGAVGAGFALPTWALVVGSSLLFGLGHTAQGAVGVVVTATLGLVLAVAFVWTGSLAVVVVAHYVVNALEFGVREGLLD